MASETPQFSSRIGRHRAEIIARHFAAHLAAQTRPGDLRAVYLIGSLGGGYYRPGSSDIDTALILADDCLAHSLEARKRLQRRYQATYGIPKGFGAFPLRLAELHPPHDPQAERVPEIIRLKEQGLLIWGRFDLDAVPYPSDEDFLAWCRVFYPWLRAKQQEPLPEGPLRTATLVNRLLYELRLAVWHADRIHVFNKQRAVPAFLAASNGAFAEALAPVQHHLEADAPIADLAALQETLVGVSSYVSRTVPL